MYSKPPHQAAFTLLELIIVVVIVGILSAYITARSDGSSSYQQDAVIEQVISAGRMAQQFSMNDSSRSFQLVTQTNQINLQVHDGSSFVTFTPGSVNYPLSINSQVELSAKTITYNSLGETSFETITVKAGGITESVCFEASGYIHQC